MKKLLCLLLVLAIALFLTTNSVFAETDHVVTGDYVNLRSAPRIAYGNVITQLHSGEKVEILKKSGEWYLIKTNTYKGYIHSDYVGVKTTGNSAVTTASVNFRKGPSKSHKIYFALPKGVYVKVLSTSSEWYKVEYKGKTGYVYSEYLEMEYERETLLGVYSTSFYTGTTQSGRVKNIKKAAKLIDEKIIEPGETFSLLNAIGPITKKGGYYEAPEYQRTPNGTKTVTGYGGGVCQVATTLYQSICDAKDSGSKITITEHQHHSKDVYYVAKGEDATISWNAKQDFCFRNDNRYSIRIRTYVYNGNISVMIFRAD